MPVRDASTVGTVPARPHTVMSCAVSLDGYLDDASRDRLILSGPADLDEVDELRARSDAILVGAGTIRADNPRLLIRDPARAAAREAAGKPPHPLRVTVTATGDLDPAARFFSGPGTPLVYAATAAVPAARARLAGKAAVIDAGVTPSLAAVLKNLYTERMVLSLLVEPGAQMARELLAADLADELRLAIAPFFVGDKSAPRFAMPAYYPHGPTAPMALIDVRRLDDLVVLRYRLGDGRGY
jgi:5-amino-6-(5-phosphoribosylamino)uracil reductase